MKLVNRFSLFIIIIFAMTLQCLAVASDGEEMSEAKITIYGTANCGYCKMAKSFMDQNKMAYKEVDLSNDVGKWNELKQQTGATTVPYIFLGEEYIGGATDLLALHQNGELAKKLK